MKAIVQKGYGPPERVLTLEDVDRPPVGDDEVLVRLGATSVNTPDWITVTGIPYILRLRSGLRGPRAPIRGTDVAGIVEAVGPNVTDRQPGDEVFGSSWAGGADTPGTFAELAVVPAAQLIEKAGGLTFEDAAASVMSGVTALIAIREVAGSVPGPGSWSTVRRAVSGPLRSRSQRRSVRRSPACPAPGTWSCCAASAPIASSTTRPMTSRATRSATT
jgi:NADPH:quinone reductase-like Zn-dependent oxidoreductase